MGIRHRWSPGTWAWESVSNWSLAPRLWNTIRETWYLGFTSFGGPPVHFKIVCPYLTILALLEPLANWLGFYGY